MIATPVILCFGAAHWDVIARAEAGLRGADCPGRVEERPGGVAFNVACGLARQGAGVALVAALGDDEDGDRLARAAQARDVDAARMLRFRGAATGRYVAIERSDGELAAAVADAGATEALEAGHLALDDAPPAALWFMDANLPTPVLRALAGHAARPPLYADAVSEAKAGKLRDLLPKLDGIYCNRAEAEAICATGLNAARAAAEALVMRGAARAVVTNGPLPAADAGPHGVRTLKPQDGPVRSVTGAGDALIAAHLFAVAQGARAEDALEAGLAAAAGQVR